jgi:hypothetical protein
LSKRTSTGEGSLEQLLRAAKRDSSPDIVPAAGGLMRGAAVFR